jgi:hypothetical protein
MVFAQKLGTVVPSGSIAERQPLTAGAALLLLRRLLPHLPQELHQQLLPHLLLTLVVLLVLPRQPPPLLKKAALLILRQLQQQPHQLDLAILLRHPYRLLLAEVV